MNPRPHICIILRYINQCNFSTCTWLYNSLNYSVILHHPQRNLIQWGTSQFTNLICSMLSEMMASFVFMREIWPLAYSSPNAVCKQKQNVAKHLSLWTKLLRYHSTLNQQPLFLFPSYPSTQSLTNFFLWDTVSISSSCWPPLTSLLLPLPPECPAHTHFLKTIHQLDFWEDGGAVSGRENSLRVTIQTLEYSILRKTRTEGNGFPLTQKESAVQTEAHRESIKKAVAGGTFSDTGSLCWEELLEPGDIQSPQLLASPEAIAEMQQ